MGALVTSKQIIFSITRYCPYECDMCAMNAGPFYSTSEKVIINSAKNFLPYLEKHPDSEIDLSGGDPLSPNAISTTLKCIEIFGQRRCSVSTTGYYLDDDIIGKLGNILGFDFTVDYSPFGPTELDPRPIGYHQTVRAAITKSVKAGIPVSVCTVLTNITGTPRNIRAIQEYLDDAGVGTWIWLPLFPIGRARWYVVGTDNVNLISLRDSLNPKKIQPKLQHVLRKGPCHAKDEVLYISSEGELVGCPWALLENGRPNKKFILGDLSRLSCNELLAKHWEVSTCPAYWKKRRVAA